MLSSMQIEAAYIAINTDREVLDACQADVKMLIEDTEGHERLL
jgi:hypothetical protein